MSEYMQLLEQRKALDKAISTAHKAESEQVIIEVRRMISDYCLTSSDCGFFSAPSVDPMPDKTNRKPAAVKYVGPNGEKWSGRGRSPAWMKEAIAGGRQQDEFYVQQP